MSRLCVVAILVGLVGACSSAAENNDDNNAVTICTELACADSGMLGGADAADETDAGNMSSADMTTPDVGVDDGAPAPTLMATEANEADVLYGWVAAGQPSEARIAEIVETGATIISLRLLSEETFDEEALITSLGGTFIRYPTTGASYDDMAFRESMYDLYDSELDAGHIVYLHCASSNRVGASWAMYQAERKGVDPEEAVAMGKAAGLSSLESTVRALLGL